MKPTIRLDLGQFRRDVDRLRRVTEQSAGQILKQWGRVFIVYCVKFTPPVGKHPVGEGMTSMRKRGEATLASDLKKLFYPATKSAMWNSASAFKTQRGKDARKARKVQAFFRKYVRANNTQAIATMVTRMGGNDTSWIVEGSPEQLRSIHVKRRNAKGRVRGRNSVMVTNAKALVAYAAEMKTHVGKAKAGWLKAFAGLGAKLAGMEWVRRHAGKVAGLFIDNSLRTRKHEIWVGNGIAYGGQFDARRVLGGAFEQLHRSMKISADKQDAHNQAGGTFKRNLRASGFKVT